MRRLFLKLLFSLMLLLHCSAFFIHAEETVNPFTDVTQSLGGTTYKAILWAYQNGIVKGTSNTTYSPDANCTRANLAVMLYRLYGEQQIEVSLNPFRDVSSKQTSTNSRSIVWCYVNDVVKGTSSDLYSPSETVTRAQIAVMLYRLAGSPDISQNSPFIDVSSAIGNTTHKAILWAYQEGITKGTSPSTFSPAAPCTRAQIAVFLYRYYEYVLQEENAGQTGNLPDYAAIYMNADTASDAVKKRIEADLKTRGFTNATVTIVSYPGRASGTVNFQTPPGRHALTARIIIKIQK